MVYILTVCNLKSEIENGRAVSEHGSGKDFQYIFECDSGYWFQDGNAAYCNKDGEAVYPICQKSINQLFYPLFHYSLTKYN